MNSSFLQESGYTDQNDTGVWTRSDYQGIPYSDGDLIEEEIEQVIDSATDRSLHSKELASQLNSWAKKYHMSAGRGHLLKPLEGLLKGKNVLEIGAGCGAITRYLGEIGANVTAMEGSPRRARICRKRTQGIESVQVVCERFAEFNSTAQFDVVTLIGVLEYAAIYGSTKQPHLDMVREAKRHLKPGGVLIIAIENQLGLKYFAGALEDHLGEPFYGIESHYGHNQPKTFGRKELQDIVHQAGYHQQVVMAPFPDYKLPTVVVTEAGFSDPRFNAAMLIAPTEASDEQSPKLPVFSQFRTWPAVLRNGLGMELANSFLLIASDTAIETDRNILAHYFGGQRDGGTTKYTVFRQGPEGNPVVLNCGTQNENAKTTSKPSDTDSYIKSSESMFEVLQCILTSRRSTVEDVVDFFQTYRENVCKLAQIKSFSTNPELPPHFLDAIPQNILIDENGDPQLIDSEWLSEQPLCFDQLLFRAIIYSLNGSRLIRLSGDNGEIALAALVTRIFSGLDIPLDKESLESMADKEASFQLKVNNLSDVSHWKRTKNAPIRKPDIFGSHDSWTNAHKVALLNIAAYQENEKKLGSVISELKLHNENLKNALNAIRSSTSWRLTAPLRKVLTRLK